MIPNTTTIVAILSTFAVLLSSGTARAMEFTEAEKERLKAGKTIKKVLENSSTHGFYGGSGFTLVDAPEDVVWKALLDFNAYNRIFSATDAVKEVSRKGNESLIHYKMGYKMINLEYYVAVKTNPKTRTISFDLVKNRRHDISMARGYWKLFPQKGGRTLLAYVVSAKIPAGVTNLIKDDWHPVIERNLIGAPNDIKKWLATASAKKYF